MIAGHRLERGFNTLTGRCLQEIGKIGGFCARRRIARDHQFGISERHGAENLCKGGARGGIDQAGLDQLADQLDLGEVGAHQRIGG